MSAIEATSARRIILALGFGLAVLPSAFAQQGIVARVKSDRVNLRARAEATSEVVGQAGLDEPLAVAEVQEEWVRVEPPARVDVWVHRDFVKDGRSTVDRLNIRAGAGINYSVVGTVGEGAALDVRGQFGEWVKIAPTQCFVWISRDFVDVSSPGRTLPSGSRSEPEVAAPPAMPAAEAAAALGALPVVTDSRVGVAPTAPVGPPPDLRLVPLEGQGRQVQREGELKPAPFVFGRPSKFRLVKREGAQLATVCYVRGNSEQLTSLLNQRLLVRGREYWVQGVRQPVVVLERIERRAP